MILTEEELKKVEVFKNQRLGVSWEVVLELISSHRELFKANAELSFKNQKLQDEVNSSNHRRESAEMSMDYAWTLHKELDKINANYLEKFNEAIETFDYIARKNTGSSTAIIALTAIDKLRKSEELK